MLPDWAEELTPEMIPDGLYRELAMAIGVSNLLKLANIAGGTTFYMPKRDTLLRKLRDQKITKEYDGYNANKLAIKYNLSTRSIETIANSKV